MVDIFSGEESIVLSPVGWSRPLIVESGVVFRRVNTCRDRILRRNGTQLSIIKRFICRVEGETEKRGGRIRTVDVTVDSVIGENS